LLNSVLKIRQLLKNVSPIRPLIDQIVKHLLLIAKYVLMMRQQLKKLPKIRLLLLPISVNLIRQLLLSALATLPLPHQPASNRLLETKSVKMTPLLPKMEEAKNKIKIMLKAQMIKKKIKKRHQIQITSIYQ